MATMDIFEGDAFSIIELTRALENIPFKPAILSGAALFGSRGVRARTVMIESRDGTLSLIPFSERGSAYENQIPERREMRAFVCRQFKKQDVLWASEIQKFRQSGTSVRKLPSSRYRPRSHVRWVGCATTLRPPSSFTCSMASRAW
jgi:hypothetical protein